MKQQFTSYSDTVLFDALKRAKPESEYAFAELYNRYNQRIYSYCLKVTGNADEARDIFQETFIRFFRSAAQEAEIENVGGFVMRIARNLCLNYNRDKKETIAIEDFHLTYNPLNYEQEELLGLVQTALEYLDYEYREVFVMRQYHDLSYEEIAEITGDTIPALKNRVWRAKEKIKHILSPYIADISKL
ncbi:MAG: RNA polymerase sigma factor [Ignavibacteriae bacterium]|nr:RNA polymerase sigma factor [Ignavibacteriota bacterium]